MKQLLSHTIKGIILMAVLLFIAKADIHAQEPQITLSLDKKTVEKGEPVQLTITVSQKNTNTTPQNIEIEGIEQFGHIGESLSTQIRMINGTLSTVTVITKSLVIQEGGDYEIGPARVTIPDQNGNPTEITSNTVSLHVQAIAPGLRPTNTPLPSQQKSLITQPPQFITLPPVQDTEQKKLDLDNNNKENPLNVLSIAYQILYYGLIALLVVLLARLIFMILKKQKKSHTLPLQKKGNYENKIHNKTDNNYENKIPDPTDPDFYLHIKQIIKTYLEKKCGFDLKKRTTQEIDLLLKKNEIHEQEAISILKTCDWNKYAKGDTEKEDIIKKIKKYV